MLTYERMEGELMTRMRRTAVLRAALFLFFLLGTNGHAQLRIVIDTLDASKFPTIRAKVKATLGNAAIQGLSVANYTVFEDGVIQAPVTGYCEDTLAAGPVSVMLVIDKSNSMGPLWGNAIEDAKRAASSFVDRLSPNDEAALVSFNDAPSFDQTWTSNKAVLKAAINAIRTLSGTAIWDALITSSNLMKTRTKKRVMILLTDGDDQNSSATFNTALNAVKTSGSVLFTIGLGSGIQTGLLTTLATETGGKYYSAPKASDLDAIYSAISRDISTTGICELRYTSRLDCLDGGMHTVTITVNYGGDDESASGTFRLPTDSSTFSFVDLLLADHYVVEAGTSISVPVELVRVSTNRPPRSFDFSVRFDASLLTLDSAAVTPLTRGWSVSMQPSPGGASVHLQGAAALLTPGSLVTLSFSARDIESSAKSRITLTPPDVKQRCTIATATDGIVAVSGRCERALVRSVAVPAAKSALLATTPNPFNPGTWVGYAIGRDGHATLRVFDEAGRQVAELLNAAVKTGAYRVWFDGSSLATGVYFLQLHAADASDSKRIMLMK